MALALGSVISGCSVNYDSKPKEIVIKNYKPANNYDVKFGLKPRGYGLIVGNLTGDGFKEYILAEDSDGHAQIDKFKIVDKDDRDCLISETPTLENCNIPDGLKALATKEKLSELERRLMIKLQEIR